MTKKQIIFELVDMLKKQMSVEALISYLIYQGFMTEDFLTIGFTYDQILQGVKFNFTEGR